MKFSGVACFLCMCFHFLQPTTIKAQPQKQSVYPPLEFAVEQLIGPRDGGGITGTLKGHLTTFNKVATQKIYSNHVIDVLKKRQSLSNNKKLNELQSRLKEIKSNPLKPADYAFALSELFNEIKTAKDEEKATIDGLDAKPWSTAGNRLKEEFELLLELKDKVDHPGISTAIRLYETVIQDFVSKSELLKKDLKQLTGDATSGFSSLQGRIIHHLGEHQQIDGKSAIYNLLRIAVYGKSEAGQEAFYNIALGQLNTPNPLFMDALTNVARIDQYDIDDAGKPLTDYVVVLGLIEKLASVSKPKLALNSQSSLTDFLHNQLIPQFQKLKNEKKADELYAPLMQMTKTMYSNFDSSLKPRLNSAINSIATIEFVSPDAISLQIE